MSIAINEFSRGHPQARQWLMLALLVVAFAFTYQEPWGVLINTWWTDTTFSHGLAIVPMSLWLMWRKREELARIALQPSWVGLGLLCIALGILLLGRFMHVRVLEQLGLIGMLQSLVPLVLGVPATKILIFPLGFLWFAVPFGKELVPSLMEVTADLSVFFLRLTGVPVYRDGMLLQIPAGTYEVARACSGIKFLTAAAALGTFYAYCNYQSLRKRVTFIGVSLAVAIVSNGIRAYLLVLIGHLTNMTFQHDRWHIVLGYVVFFIILCLLFYSGQRYRDDPAPVSARVTPVAGIGARAADARGASWQIPLLGLLLLAGAPVYARAFMQSGGSPAAIAAMSIRPTAADGWQDAGDAVFWRPHVSGGVQRVEGSYRKGAETVELFIEVFPLPGADGSEMIAYRNRIQFDANERLYPDRVRSTLLAAHPQFEVRETTVSGAQERLVWYWYDVDGMMLVSPSRAKLAEALALLRHGRGAQRLIVLSTPVDAGSDPVRRLDDFVRAHGAQLLAEPRG